MAPTYVYVLKDPTGLAKLGISGKPSRRHSQIQVNTPHKLEMIGAWRFGRQAAKVERVLLDAFAELRVSGEWLRIEPTSLAFIVGAIHSGKATGALVEAAIRLQNEDSVEALRAAWAAGLHSEAIKKEWVFIEAVDRTDFTSRRKRRKPLPAL